MTDTKEVTVVPASDYGLAIHRAPEEVLGEAQKAATVLTQVLRTKRKPLMFQGEQYLEYEDWLTVARFYGLAVKTKNAGPVEVDGIKGAMATAEVMDVKTGQTVGSAEAYCMRDERNWGNKPWFQLASMAQTRAGAKALRNLLSWVVVLGGYRGTPAEELEGTDAPAAHPAPGVVTEAQAKRFYAIAKTEGHWTDEAIKTYLMTKFQVDSTFKIPAAGYEAACLWAKTRTLVDTTTGETFDPGTAQ